MLKFGISLEFTDFFCNFASSKQQNNMSMETIDINKFLFGRTNPTKKLGVIKAMSDNDIRKATSATILHIYNECKGDRDRFCISSDRRAGNNWNSTIEFLYEYNGKPYLCLYVQNSSTDSSECVSYDEFNDSAKYRGYCDRLTMFFTYNSKDIANVIRCILMEYVYYKYIEKTERERRERIEKVLDWKIYNPVCNQFYDEWRCRYEGFGFNSPTPRTNRYHRAEKAVKVYVEEHIDELDGKSVEELQSIYRKIFRETN